VKRRRRSSVVRTTVNGEDGRLIDDMTTSSHCLEVVARYEFQLELSCRATTRPDRMRGLALHGGYRV